jgi:hypothetical protein
MPYDYAMQMATRRAIQRAGELVTFQRLTGTAPNVTTISVSVYANVQGLHSETTEPSQEGLPSTKEGAITQTARKLIVIGSDLSAGGFPLPVKKNDKIILADGTKCNVLDVDAHKRSIADAIEINAAEVA